MYIWSQSEIFNSLNTKLRIFSFSLYSWSFEMSNLLYFLLDILYFELILFDKYSFRFKFNIFRLSSFFVLLAMLLCSIFLIIWFLLFDLSLGRFKLSKISFIFFISKRSEINLLMNSSIKSFNLFFIFLIILSALYLFLFLFESSFFLFRPNLGFSSFSFSVVDSLGCLLFLI